MVGVSVLITTYNQKDYIKDAIEGALRQKTNFVYEILIHDDASTDGTTEIVMEYEKKYPDKIVAYYEQINMYAHCEVFLEKMLEKAKGKYLAICDGDDYWIDENKLQLQFDFMESNPEFYLCTHNTKVVDLKTGEERKFFERETMELLRGEVIERAGATFHSSSHFFRLESWYDKHKGNDLADMPRVLWCCNEGRVMCFENVMSVYRVHTKGSWSESVDSCYSLISDFMKRLTYYEQFNQKTNGIWDKHIRIIQNQILSHTFHLLRPHFRLFSIRSKLVILLGVLSDFFGIWRLTIRLRKEINCIREKINIKRK